MKKIAALAAVLLCLTASAQEDPNLWLEGVTGPKPLEWEKAQNQITQPVLEATPDFKLLQARLLAGASWLGEYGDPDQPADWHFIGTYSTYQNVFKDRTYPKVFIWTTTRDDRVHPGHARKMAAKKKDQGHDARGAVVRQHPGLRLLPHGPQPAMPRREAAR